MHAADLKVGVADLGSGQSNVIGRDKLRSAVESLAQIRSLASEVRLLFTHELFEADSSVLPTPSAQNLSHQVLALRGKVDILKAFLDDTLGEAPPHYFAVKLPVHEGTTDDVSKLINRFHIGLDQPVRRLGYAPLKARADVGSWWVELACESKMVLVVVGALLTTAVSVAKAKQAVEESRQAAERTKQEGARADQEQAKVRQEEARAEQEASRAEQERFRAEISKFEFARKVAEARLDTADLESERMIQELVQQIQDPNEVANTVRRAIKELAELHIEGAEFRLQLDAPADVSAAFPAEAKALSDQPRRLELQA